MSKVCNLCGKKPMIGNTVSHAHNVTKRRFFPNLKKVKITKNGKSSYLQICMKCLKAGKVGV